MHVQSPATSKVTRVKPARAKARTKSPRDLSPLLALPVTRAPRILGAGGDAQASHQASHQVSHQGLAEPFSPWQPHAHSLLGPRGICLWEPTGPLWVADTGHHRLLGWRRLPTRDHQAADWVIGQVGFERTGPNAQGTLGSASLHGPTGLCALGKGMVVADAWNHRILIWRQVPEADNVPADWVLGQANFQEGAPNRGQRQPGRDRLYWPYGVAVWREHLLVADTGNRRVLIWNSLPQGSDQPADVVLGQGDFQGQAENGHHHPSLSGMRWPHSVGVWRGNLVVADAGNNRIMVWNGIPTQNHTPCAVVLGQADGEQIDPNRGQLILSDRSLNMPYGLTVIGDWLMVADTANSRLLGWHYPGNLEQLHDAPAEVLMGPSLLAHAPGLELCWPYAIHGNDHTLAIADSGHNRLLVWPLS